VAALSYVLGPVSGLFVLITERENKYVRFHALQATLWFSLVYILLWVTLLFGGWLIGFLLSPVRWILSVVLVLSAVFLILRALKGHEFKLPFIGDVAWSRVNK